MAGRPCTVAASELHAAGATPSRAASHSHRVQVRGGSLPASHLALMRLQLAQLRNGLFRTAAPQVLILPTMHCGCELGFFPRHIAPGCRRRDHRTLRLPYACAIDHVLNPMAIATSPYALRELRCRACAPSAAVRQDVTTVVVGGDAAGVAAATTTARARRRRRDAVIHCRTLRSPRRSSPPLAGSRGEAAVEDVSEPSEALTASTPRRGRVFHAVRNGCVWCCRTWRRRSMALPGWSPPAPCLAARMERGATLRWADRALRALVETHST